MIRKFYDIGFPDFTGATLADFKIIEPGAEPEQIVEAVTPPEEVTTPEIAAVTTEPVASPVVEQPPVQAKVEAPVVVAPEPVQLKPWEDTLRDNGYDDYAINLLKYYKETGSATPYLEAHSVDYTKMQPEEIMRHDLQKQYPGLSREAMDLLFREEVIDRYKLDPDVHDGVQAELGKARLQRDSDAKRAQFIEHQAKFKAPERTPDDSALKQQQAQAAYDKQIQDQEEAFKQTITANASTQQLLKDKRLVFDGGEEGLKFNFEAANPQELVDVMLDAQKYQQALTKPDGTPDVQKMLLLSAVAKDPQLVIKSLINYGKSLGTKSLEAELTNASKPADATIGAQEETFEQAFLRRGVSSRVN